MSELKVEVVRIDSIEKYPKPKIHSLEIAKIKGWLSVVSKGFWKVGDLALYIPTNSILNQELEEKLFSDGKVKLKGHRIRTIMLHGVISQGILVKPEELGITKYKMGDNFIEELKIGKYEPPPLKQPNCGKLNSAKYTNPNFNKYTDIQNFKNYDKLFKEGDEISITEKIHGTNARYGKVKNDPHYWWQKVLKYFNFSPKYIYLHGCHNIQLKKKWFSPNNVYAEISKMYDLEDLLKPNEVIYGEIYGHGIQKNYSYGLKDEIRFVVFDVKINGKYLDPEDCKEWCEMRSLPTVPYIYTGEYSEEKVKKLVEGESEIGGQKIKEGIVIKPKQEEICYMGRKVLKLINDKYLLKENTEFH